MRWFTVAATLLAALTFAVAGCGGDDEASDEADTVAVDTTETETDETTDETTDDTDTDTGDVGDIFGDEECAELVAASVAFAQAFAAAGQGVEIDDSSEVWQRFADEAPAEIRDDIGILADAYAQYIEAFADLDLQAGEVPTQEQAQQLAAAFASLDQANIAAASQNISTWADANCPGG